MTKALFALGLLAVAGAMELTPENWDEATAGKTVLIKFQAPWWGHCKSMKPDFDKLIADYAGSKTVLIADVDCTAEGKDLCETHGVEGFPTIKWGDPSALEDFEGGRDYEAMAEFAKENLKPMCSPSNIDLCDADKKKQIADLQALSSDALDAQIAEKEQLQKDAEETFTKEVEALQARYEELSKEKEAAQKAVKDSGLALMKAVKGAKDAKDEL